MLLDPPRKGCEASVLHAISQAQVPRIVYISCGAPALARDAALLCAEGYRVERIQCVDMFCLTGDVETVTLLSRRKDELRVQVTMTCKSD